MLGCWLCRRWLVELCWIRSRRSGGGLFSIIFIDEVGEWSRNRAKCEIVIRELAKSEVAQSQRNGILGRLEFDYPC